MDADPGYVDGTRGADCHQRPRGGELSGQGRLRGLGGDGGERVHGRRCPLDGGLGRAAGANPRAICEHDGDVAILRGDGRVARRRHLSAGRRVRRALWTGHRRVDRLPDDYDPQLLRGRLHAGSIKGFISPIEGLVGISGPLVAAFIYDTTKSYDAAFVGAAAVFAVGAGAFFLARPLRVPIAPPAPVGPPATVENGQSTA